MTVIKLDTGIKINKCTLMEQKQRAPKQTHPYMVNSYWMKVPANLVKKEKCFEKDQAGPIV